MTSSIPREHPLHRLFRGLTEHTFATELGVADPRLVDYVSDLLARFVPSDMVWAMRDSVGRRLSDFWVMRATAEAAEDADAQRERHRHVGDFSLFWTGVYPESAARVASGTVRVTLGDLQREGQRAYLVASTMARDEEAAVLRRLSAEFSLCAFGLGRVRQEWERREPPNAAGPGVILA